MSIEFRYADLRDYSRISQFLDEHWAKDHIYVRNRSLFDWTFTRRKHWEDETYSFAIAEDGYELVAILGGIPFALNCFGKVFKAVWIVNYGLRPDYRRGPVALQLLSTFRRPPFDAVIASGLNPASIAIYKVLRGIVLPEMPRHFAVLPGAVSRAQDLLRLTHPDWPDERAKDLARAFTIRENEKACVRYGSALPDSWDDVDWPTIAAQTAGAARDSDYLRWRYANHPSFNYRIITVSEGERTGLAIWRLDQIQLTSSTGRISVDRFARLVEFLPVSDDNAAQLLGALVEEIRRSDALGFDFYGYHGPTRLILQRNGIKSTDAHADGRLIPSRFQPLDVHVEGILNAMFAPEGLPACTTECDSPWYWTKSDSDQDRPN